MSRKDYIKFAAMLKAERVGDDAAAGFDEGYDSAVLAIAENMADIFGADNPNFDRARFLTACGF